MSRRDSAVVKHGGSTALQGLVMVLSGLLYGCCFPPLAWRWFAWVVLIAPLTILRQSCAWRGAWLGALLATAGAACTVAWLPATVHVYFQQPLWVGWCMFAAVVLLMVVPPYAAVGALYGRLDSLPSWLVPPTAASAWVAGEYFRSHVLTGNPWVLWGYSQSGVLPVMQIADLTGVYGVTWLLALLSCAAAELLVHRRFDWRVAALPSVCLVLALIYGQVRLHAASQVFGPPSRVLVVQENLDLGAQWREELYGRNLEAYLRPTMEELLRQPAPLVVWPESAMTFFVDEELPYQASLGSVLKPLHAQLVAGGPHRTDASDAARYFNSAFLIDATGAPVARYDKIRLLPFAEYFPFAWSDLLQRDFGRVRQFTAATQPTLLPTLAGRAGVIICNEAMFPEMARDNVRRGAELLINLTNDTWVNDAQFSGIAFDMARFRAVEQRRYLVRASTAGPSAIVAPSGAVEAQSELFQMATVRGTVQPTSQLSIYGSIGDVFAWLCIAFAALGGIVAVRRKLAADEATEGISGRNLT